MPDLNAVPRQRNGHHLQEVDGEHVLFGRRGAKAIYLNESASVVWQLCDGVQSIQHIVTALKEAFPENAEIEADVLEAIDKLVHEGALTCDEPSAAEG